MYGGCNNVRTSLVCSEWSDDGVGPGGQRTVIHSLVIRLIVFVYHVPGHRRQSRVPNGAAAWEF